MSGDASSLDRLHDIVVPAPVPWWPPAPGWYVALGMLALLALCLAVQGLLHWQRNRYRREALSEWQRQAARLGDPTARRDALAAMALLSKRAALSAYPRPLVASLSGSAWGAFLERAGNVKGFDSETGALLEDAAYGIGLSEELDEGRAHQAAALAREWLLRHRVELNDGGAEPC